MRLVTGQDLGLLVRAGGPLPLPRAVSIVAQVAPALDAAHAAGLVHRDVKPANVLVTPDELGDHAYLTDFGLTKQLDTEDSLTVPGFFIGTVDYVSPEQIRGGEVGPESDVYSLGCLLHYALMGRPPFAFESKADVLAAHWAAEPPSLPPELKAVEAAYTRALAKSPAHRFGSAGAFARAVSRG